MLSIERTRAAIIECHAGALALDSVPPLAQMHPCRVAPDELLLIAPPWMADDLLRRATAHLASAEAGTLVIDQSDAWAVFTLRGDDALRPLRQLSANPFPDYRPAFVQGAIAGGAAKVLLLPKSTHILVPYVLRDHLAQRLRDVCGPAVLMSSVEVPFSGDSPAPTNHHMPATPR